MVRLYTINIQLKVTFENLYWKIKMSGTPKWVVNYKVNFVINISMIKYDYNLKGQSSFAHIIVLTRQQQ